MPSATPMMRQYQQIKRRHRDAILFFRLGDFYEMFEQDAVEASRLLDLTLTKRNGVPMCGIPYHAAPNYIARLLKSGKKIAVCEQTHVPGDGKGIARREVAEVITPGTVVDENMLERSANNYLVCLGWLGENLSLAYIDLSTAEFYATHCSIKGRAEALKQELLRLEFRELLIQESLLEEDQFLNQLLAEKADMVVNRFPDWHFDLDSNRERLKRQFKIASLRGLGLEDDAPEIITAGVILEYISEASKSLLVHIRGLKVYSEKTYLGLDESTQRNLELVQNLNDRSRRYTLLEVLDQSKTAMGARMMKRWILRPLKEPEAIEERLKVVDFFYRHQILLAKLREQLAGIFDLERLSSKLALERAHAKDLLAIMSSLAAILSTGELIAAHEELKDLSRGTWDNMEQIQNMVHLLQRSILDDPSILLTEGNLIKPGYHEGLDHLRELKRNARQVLEQYLAEERQETGIVSLKLKYNRIIGYFLEVTKANLHLVPAHFIRRQTLVNGERFTTEALADKESEINNASEKIIELEKELFLEIRSRLREQIDLLLEACAMVSELDVLQSFAFAATVHGYVRPVIKTGGRLKIKEGRHPVVEANLPGGSFVPNDVRLSKTDHCFVLLTGPNMAGKSTYLRQVALIVLMAQIGSFVPAREAEIGIVDHIFCRVGATDNLARGESTFLVEMIETAHILRSATQNSLIIMDEVGRGTGTSDGLAIAWAVSEYLLHHLGAKTLFATHYRQLTGLKHRRLVNLSMAVLEKDEEIVFLKQVREGPADNSYGIHVARLAGIPREVTDRARLILADLVEQELNHKPNLKPLPKTVASTDQPLLFPPLEVLRDEILAMNIGRTTPLEALNRLARWQKELGK